MSVEDEKIRVIPVFKSLIRPQLIVGGDRTLVICLMVCSGILMGPGGMGSGNILNFVLGIFLLVFGLRALNKMAKYDPQSFPVFKKAMTYKPLYLASSGFEYKRKSRKK